MYVTVLLIILVIVLLCAMYIAYRQKVKQQQRADGLLLQVNDYERLLRDMPHLLCYWYEGSRFVNCSQALRQLLRFEPDELIRLDQWNDRLSDGPFSPFQKSLNHLMEYGGDFYLQLTLWHGEVHVGIHGRKIPLSPGTFQTHVIVLAFTHISQFVQEHQLFAQQKREIEQLRLLCDNIPMIVWLRSEQGRLTYCNHMYGEFLNTTRGRILAENRELIAAGPNFDGTYALHQRACEQKNPVHVRTHAVWQGERKWLEVGETWLGSEFAQTVGYAMDCSELFEVEGSLQRTIRANQDMMELLSTAMCVYGPDYRLSTFNSAYQKIFGFDETWLLKRPTLGEVLDDLRERRRITEYPDFPSYKRARMGLFQTMFSPIHDTLYQPNGRTLRMVIAPHPLGGIFYLFDDITEHTQLEQNYQSLQATHRTILEHTSAPIIIFGGDHRLRVINVAFARAFDIKETQAGSHVMDLLRIMSPNDAWLANLQQHINSRTASNHLEPLVYQYLPLPDGSHFLKFATN
jgi:PAS domain-containing protein